MELENNKKFGLSAAFLKYVALLFMIINHVFCTYFDAIDYNGFWDNFQWWATRLSFVLYAFLISEGMKHTHSRKNYILKLGLFALISEIPHDLCFYNTVFEVNNFNNFFTLCIGALAIAAIDNVNGVFVRLLAAFGFCLLGSPFSYGFVGIAVILCFYYLSDKPWLMYISVAFFLINYYYITYIAYWPMYFGTDLIAYLKWITDTIGSMTFVESSGIAAFPLIALYDGRKGQSHLPGIAFYIIYPAHLLLIYIAWQILL